MITNSNKKELEIIEFVKEKYKIAEIYKLQNNKINTINHIHSKHYEASLCVKYRETIIKSSK